MSESIREDSTQDSLLHLPPSEIIKLFPPEEWHLPSEEELAAILDQTRRLSPYFGTHAYQSRASVSQQDFYAVLATIRIRVQHRNDAATGDLAWIIGRYEQGRILDHSSRPNAKPLQHRFDTNFQIRHSGLELPERPLTLYGVNNNVFEIQAVRTHMPEEKDSKYYWVGGELFITR